MFAQQGDDTNLFYCGTCKKKHDYNYLDCVILKRAKMKMATTNAQITTQPETNDNQSVATAGNLQQNQQHQQHLQQQIVPYNNGANNNAPRAGQQFLINTTIDYDTNDDDDNDNCNPDLVYNIYKVNYRCTVATNAGTTSTCFKASLRQDILPSKKEMETWFDPDGIANILALHIVQKYFRVNYTNWEGPKDQWNKFIVHLPNEKPLYFTMTSTGLYYANLKFLTPPTASMFMQTKLSSLKFPPTIAEWIEEFSKKEQEDARNA